MHLDRRQSATMAGLPTDQARVCLAAPPTALSHAVEVSSTRGSEDGRPVRTLPEPSAWEARVVYGELDV